RNDAVDTVVERNSKLIENLLSKDFGRPAKSFNLSFGGAMVSDQYLLASSLFNSKHKPKVVILGINPRDFIDNSLPAACTTDPYQLLGPYANLEGLEFASFSNPLEWLEWKMNNEFAFRSQGKAFADTVAGAVSKLVQSATGSATEIAVETSVGETTEDSDGKAANQTETGDMLKSLYQTAGEVSPGQWKVVATSWGAFKDNTREYQTRYKNSAPAIYPQEKQFFERLLAHLKSENIKTLVVGMPSLWPNRALLPESFWSEFRGYVASTTSAYGAEWVDFTDSKEYTSNHYLDTVHLNSTGGVKLMQAIANRAKPIVADLNKPERDDKTPAVAGTGADL
ncbi:MAG: hypothetical protein K2Z81_05140, partial [Cyanobacteria bacterium]|nr:hypothetical protein [Cyanobacteriota bacterium]